VLKWARDHGCPWNRRTIRFADSHEHWEVSQWVREHGCPE
jgi:hypothetical protein